MAPQVRHSEDSSNFVALLDGQRVGTLSYAVNGDVWQVYSTHVDPAFEGRGIGSALTLEAVQAAESAGVRIDPSCWFVAEWFDRHPEYQDVRLAS